ncbi:MAG: bifunctional demethylmenaquinone methyltransferase/2-methoxy-6-polyprenyl-1,4-benzoquinol methylase [Hirschia sp.]|nr:bifunctional demethylmenaquinone methyltransferase/2-methoxy-6-polyprenyl-1,4-benzoquinol methylase [Hirschia sp.]
MTDDKVSFGFEDISRDEKVDRVKGVFHSVADKYDLMNDLMSAGVHRIWKANMIARLNPQPGEYLLDCAGGTGDIARAFVAAAEKTRKRRGKGEPARAIVSDINDSMLRAGLEQRGDAGLQWACADATNLPFPDKTFDVVTISFGIRNVVDIPAALREFRRVLKPGGRFACLEFSHMATEGMQKAYDTYSFNVIPALGKLVTGDRDSYQYLVESIRRFPKQDVFADMIREAGFSNVSVTNYTGGVSALHMGWAV